MARGTQQDDPSEGEKTPPSGSVAWMREESTQEEASPWSDADAVTPEAGEVSFDTVPGGGANRVSGGRAVARAYVSPKTPLPLSSGRQDTVSIDLDPHADLESRGFPTAPSLFRRRRSASEHGQLSSVGDEKFSWVRGVALTLMGALLGFIVVFVFFRDVRLFSSRKSTTTLAAEKSTSDEVAQPASTPEVRAAQPPSPPVPEEPGAPAPSAPAATQPASENLPSAPVPVNSAKKTSNSSQERPKPSPTRGARRPAQDREPWLE